MEMANITFQDDDGNIRVKIDHERCITCGRCISACKHDARYFKDDTERFFYDLSKGMRISIIAAPSIRTNMPEYKRFFTYLKRLGVRYIYDVSLGADICIWAHIKHMETNNRPIITQPCPVIVNYCEMYRNDLLRWLSPVHSPMACASIYMNKYQGINDRIAAISPCIAKSNEFRETGLASYNITFYKLLEYLWVNNITLPDEETGFDHDDGCLGVLFPLPGGLKENIEFFAGKKLHIVKGEGYGIYEKLNTYAEMPEEMMPDIFDVLSCTEGCSMGSACVHEQNVFEISKLMNGGRKKVTEARPHEYYEQIFRKYSDTFELSHFMRDYSPASLVFPEITDADISNAFEQLGKVNYVQQNVDCSACGSETCHDMARKIALNVNIPINCMVKAMEDVSTEHDNYIIAHEQLLEAAENAKEASNTKTTFLANMSHEIRTPMNAILGMAELLEHERLNDHQMSFVKDISASAHSLLGIINDILDMSKIEAGKLELNPVDYNLHQFADNIASMFAYVARNKGLEFMLEKADNLPDCLFGDDLRLRQVLTNICGNAVKFTKEGYVKLKITALGAQLIFRIEDTGMGIHKGDLSKLFNAFEQVDKSKNRNVVGTGLGLSISKSFVKMMGGEITVESEYGRGTVFSVIIPAIRGNDDNIRKNMVNEAAQALSAPNAEILVTDDNVFNLKVASGLLSLMDIQADTADSGIMAIELIKQKDYDIVFMDQMMPEMDGIETVREIRNMGGKFEELVIVALTANAVKNARDMFISNGFNDFLAKPVNSDELCEIVKKYLPLNKIQPGTGGEKRKSGFKSEEELFRKAAVVFAAGNKDTFEKISAALNSGDIKTAHRIAHTLKSGAGYLGKNELRDAAFSLEETLSGRPDGWTPEQLDVLEKELKKALIELEPLLKEAEYAKPVTLEIKSDELSELLGELEPLLKKNDFGASDYVDRLRGIVGMDKLADRIDDYDFEGALLVLDEKKSEFLQ